MDMRCAGMVGSATGQHSSLRRDRLFLPLCILVVQLLIGCERRSAQAPPTASQDSHQVASVSAPAVSGTNPRQAATRPPTGLQLKPVPQRAGYIRNYNTDGMMTVNLDRPNCIGFLSVNDVREYTISDRIDAVVIYQWGDLAIVIFYEAFDKGVRDITLDTKTPSQAWLLRRFGKDDNDMYD